MKTFPTLYKRTKTGAIQEYNITADHIALAGRIVKLTGQLGGKATCHEEIVTEGKQGRSSIEQAVFMAESDWKRKRDEGYKSLEDLYPNDTMPENISVKDLIDSAMSQFNSDASGNIKPMLATDWAKVKDIPYPVIVQPKLDGVRCLMIVNREGPEFTITFLSRSGKTYNSLEHISESVIDNIRTHEPFILDGEIYSEELSFQDIVSAVKALKENSFKLKFRAYDIVSDENQSVRLAKLRLLIKDIGSEHITEVPWTTANNAADVKDLHDMHVINGYEGAMIRFVDGKYGQGQRSRELLKVKTFDETEFPFKNFEFGQRGVEDLIAVLWTPDNKEFRAKVVGTVAQKEELYEANKNGESEGKSCTIKHFGYTSDMFPRFPIAKSFRNY